MKILYDNPFILVILIGIISSIYKKMKVNETEDGKKRSPLSQRIPTTFENPVWKNIRVREHNDQKKQAKQQITRKKSTTLYDDSDHQVNQATTETSMLAEATRMAPKENTVNLQATPNSPTEKQVQINQTTLIDGLIWSEVLGPPRAKKPYRPINHR